MSPSSALLTIRTGVDEFVTAIMEASKVLRGVELTRITVNTQRASKTVLGRFMNSIVTDGTFTSVLGDESVKADVSMQIINLSRP